MAKENLSQTVGKRKTSVARVILRERAGDQGKIVVNGRAFEDYFPRESARFMIIQPLEHSQTLGQFDIFVKVHGGGLSGQAGAVKHGIARALVGVNSELRPVIKKAGHLTRDSRMVERKKYGLAGARRRFQYSKR